MKTCPKCQLVVSDTAKFCRKCGFNIKKYEEESTVQECYCTECGEKIPADSVFCPECGTSISDQPCVGNKSFDSIGNFDFSTLESEAREQLLAAFDYEQMSNGMYIIKALKNSAELIVEIPDCVQIIDESAFEGSSVIEVTLPEGLVKIGERAFADCFDLEKINFPSTLRIIEDEAFSGCTRLDVEAPDGVRCGTDAFKGTLPWQRKENARIAAEREAARIAAEKEAELKRLEVFNFVKEEGGYCVSIYTGSESHVVISETYQGLPVTSIGEYAFSDCTGLTSIKIPDSVTSIGKSAFSYCTGLTSIKIPDSVTSIGEFVFCHCTGLTSIKIPDSVTSIDEFAFSHCTGLTSIEIPDSVTSIGNSAFNGCNGLTSIEIPDSVTSIGNSAFKGCIGLKSVTFGENSQLTSIGESAFSDCTGLTSIKIPDSVTSIGESAFSDCTGLTSIEIPDSVTSIGESAFSGCYRLKTIKVPCSLPSSLVSALGLIRSAEIIYY